MEDKPSIAKVMCYGQQLHTRCWLPGASNSVKANLLIAHGLGEHSGSYQNIASLFTDQGIAVYSHDHFGHGRSPGVPALVQNMQDIVQPLLSHASQLRTAQPTVPLFILGHSMGGLAAVLCARIDGGGGGDKEEKERNRLFKGVLLNAPALAANPQMLPAWKEMLGRFMARILPQSLMPGTEMRVEILTGDAEMQRELSEDPLQFNAGIRLGTGVAIIDAMRSIEELRAEFPFFLMHSTTDELTYFPGSEAFYDRAVCDDKQFLKFENLQHQLHNEVEPHRSKARQAMLQWILDRC